jgi:chlorobactene lauroyltransferase
MIPARKNALFNFGLRRVLSWILRRRFHNVYVAGGQHLRGLAPDSPVVGCVNHSNWWDGFVLYVLSHRLLPHDIYLAMEEKNLGRYPFFAWMGVFGLDLAGPRRALPGLRYAMRLLRPDADRRHPPLVWMFVQGSLLAAGEAPIEVKGGALSLARHTGAQILPLVLRYEWLRESRPSIFVHIGPVLPAAASAGELAEALNGLFAGVPTSVEAPAFSAYEPLYRRQMSMNKWWDYLVHRLHGSGRKFEGDNR